MRKFLKWLMSTPPGFNADGRAVGLGLGAAVEWPRRYPAADVEEYLRRVTPARRPHLAHERADGS